MTKITITHKTMMSRVGEFIKGSLAAQTSKAQTQEGLNTNVERLRLLAAFGIVVFHTMPLESYSKRVGYAGLPIFLMVFSALILSHKHEIPLRTFLRKKLNRLLGPWIFWCVVYFMAKGLKAIYTHDLAAVFPKNALIVGTSIHLWYLPYAFMTAFILFIYQQAEKRWGNRFWDYVIISLALIAYPLCAVLLSGVRVPAPMPQWLFGLPAVLLGIAIAHINNLGCTKSNLTLFGFMVGAISALTVVMNYVGITSLSTPYAIAFPLVVLCFCWPGQIDCLTLRASSLTYGIYLVHPLVISIGMRIMPPGIALCLVAFVLSGLITSMLKKTKLYWVV